MFWDTALSEVGRSTNQQIDGLRRQLGVGVDPSFDYTQIVQEQKDLAQKREKKKPPVEPPGSAAGSSALEQLRRALREVGGDEEGSPRHPGSPGPPSPKPAQHSRSRPSPAFQVCSRDEVARLDVSNAWRAPPLGTYKPKADLMVPRLSCPDFGLKEGTRSRTTVELEREVARLRAEHQPFEHLVRNGVVSVELLDHAPERLKPRMPAVDIARMLARPDIVKSAGIVYHVSLSTDGVLDGDLHCSQLGRHPSWDFAKVSGVEPKVLESYFQPGQYDVGSGLDAIGPRSETKLIPFGKQRSRRPLKEVIGRVEIDARLGDHLPDRSLSRSCPVLSTVPRKLAPNMAKCSDRPMFFKKFADYHRTEDPTADRAVREHERTYDPVEAEKVLYHRPHTVEHFNKSLNREQQIKVTRIYGEDICLQLAKENLAHGPVSVEFLSDIDTSPSLRPRVVARRFCNEQYADPPSRKRDQGKAAKFERGLRGGDGRCETHSLSPLAANISQLRLARTYEALSD